MNRSTCPGALQAGLPFMPAFLQSPATPPRLFCEMPPMEKSMSTNPSRHSPGVATAIDGARVGAVVGEAVGVQLEASSRYA